MQILDKLHRGLFSETMLAMLDTEAIPRCNEPEEAEATAVLSCLQHNIAISINGTVCSEEMAALNYPDRSLSRLGHIYKEIEVLVQAT